MSNPLRATTGILEGEDVDGGSYQPKEKSQVKHVRELLEKMRSVTRSDHPNRSYNTYDWADLLSKAIAADDWQPIQAAPIDDEMVQLWWPKNTNHNHVIGNCFNGRWYTFPESDRSGQPTHWKPLSSDSDPGRSAEG